MEEQYILVWTGEWRMKFLKESFYPHAGNDKKWSNPSDKSLVREGEVGMGGGEWRGGGALR